MVEVNILISTNALEEEKKKLYIPREAIDEFLGTGFVDNAFDGKISFECMSRVVPPDWMRIFIDLKDVAEGLIAWATIIGALIKFCKSCKGYEYDLTICKRKSNNEKIEISVNLNDKNDIDEIVKEIKELIE